MSEPVFVIQVLSDGNYGFPLDRIVEIGIVKVDIESSTVESVYSERIFLEDGSFTKKQREYLRNISGLDVSDLSNGRKLEDVISDVKRIISGKTITSFDISFTVKKFLMFEPWDITKEMTVMASIKSGVPSKYLPLEKMDENALIKYTYDLFFPDDSKCIGSGKSALDYALMSAEIMLALRNGN